MNVDDVVHCPYSCGLSLSHTSGWSLAYTGDAYELSHSFIKNGREFPFSPVGLLNLSLILILYQEQYNVEQVSIHSYEGVRVKLREMFLGFQNFCHHPSVIPGFFLLQLRTVISWFMRHHTKICMPIDDLITCTGMLSYSCIVQDVMPCLHRVLMNRSTCSLLYIKFAWNRISLLMNFMHIILLYHLFCVNTQWMKTPQTMTS